MEGRGTWLVDWFVFAFSRGPIYQPVYDSCQHSEKRHIWNKSGTEI